MDVHNCFQPHPPLLTNLYVRKCYEEVWLNYVTRYLSCDPQNDYLYVTGTPGIGKTAFLYYLLCRLKAENLSKEVMLHFGDEDFFLSSKPMPPPELPLSEIMVKSVISIFDPDNSSVVTNWRVGLGHHIVVASPDPRHIQPFGHRYNPTKVIMSVWSYEEINACYNLVYSHLNWTEVEGRFTKWGKTPRICFTLRDDTMEVNLAKLLELPGKVQNMMERMISGGPFSDNKKDEDCQRFTQINCDDSISWSSPYVQVQFFCKFSELLTSLRHRTDLLKQSNHINLGVCYEAFIIRKFTGAVTSPPENHTLQATILSGFNSSYDEAVVLEWPTSTEYFCTGQCFADVIPQRLYLPGSSTFPMIDLVFPPYLLQITTSKTHSVKSSGYDKIKKVFPTVMQWFLIFIVPLQTEGPFRLSADCTRLLNKLKVPAYTLIIDYPDKRALQGHPDSSSLS